jgi:DNA mismatch endonuclease, patch repair protein
MERTGRGRQERKASRSRPVRLDRGRLCGIVVPNTRLSLGVVRSGLGDSAMRQLAVMSLSGQSSHGRPTLGASCCELGSQVARASTDRGSSADGDIAVKRQKLSLSERMRRIRKKDTKPELLVRRILHAMGYRYRLHQPNLPGRPDIVLARHRTAIFVHGCFWHRHDCAGGRKLPKSKPEYWGPKLERNRLRDEVSLARLHELGWRVLVVWECETKNNKRLSQELAKFLGARECQGNL